MCFNLWLGIKPIQKFRIKWKIKIEEFATYEIFSNISYEMHHSKCLWTEIVQYFKWNIRKIWNNLFVAIPFGKNPSQILKYHNWMEIIIAPKIENKTNYVHLNKFIKMQVCVGNEMTKIQRKEWCRKWSKTNFVSNISHDTFWFSINVVLVTPLTTIN